MRVLELLFIAIIALKLFAQASSSNGCNQPGWTNGTTICFRLIHKPSTFQGAKEECQSLSGSLLTLDKVDEVMAVLGTSMVGNGDNYRIDGWLNATWMEQDNQKLHLNTVESTLTLVLNVEDGRVSGSWNDRARLGFICQKMAETKEMACSSSTPASSRKCNYPELHYLLYYNTTATESLVVPFGEVNCNCSFTTNFTSFPSNVWIETLFIDPSSPRYFVSDRNRSWYTFKNNQWEYAFSEGLSSDLRVLDRSFRSSFVSESFTHLLFFCRQREFDRVTFHEDSNTYSFEKETVLPRAIVEPNNPVWNLYKNAFFFGGTGELFLLQSNGSHWNVWKSMPALRPKSMDSLIRYFACEDTIYAVICYRKFGVCEGSLVEAVPASSENPWTPMGDVDININDNIRHICQGRLLRLHVGQLVFFIEPWQAFLNVHTRFKDVPETSPNVYEFDLPRRVIQCIDE